MTAAQPNPFGSRKLNDGNDGLEQENHSHVVVWSQGQLGGGRSISWQLMNWKFQGCLSCTEVVSCCNHGWQRVPGLENYEVVILIDSDRPSRSLQAKQATRLECPLLSYG